MSPLHSRETDDAFLLLLSVNPKWAGDCWGEGCGGGWGGARSKEENTQSKEERGGGLFPPPLLDLLFSLTRSD